MSETKIQVGHPVRSIASGRLGVVREITEHGYVIKFMGLTSTKFLRFTEVAADLPRARRTRKA